LFLFLGVLFLTLFFIFLAAFVSHYVSPFFKGKYYLSLTSP
jgi:hypothetical protein